MLSPKAKNKNAPQQHNRWIFLSLWLLGHSIAWIPFMIAGETLSDTLIVFTIFLGAFLGGITSLTQYLLIHRQFGHNIKSWFPLSTIGWVIGSFILHTQLLDMAFNQLNFTIQMLALAGPAILLQIFLLRKYIKQSWVWGLANFAGLATFASGLMVFDNLLDPNIFTVGSAYALFASATGMTLLWLFGMSQTPTKRKQHSIERLTDSEHETSNDNLLADDVQKQTQRLQ